MNSQKVEALAESVRSLLQDFRKMETTVPQVKEDSEYAARYKVSRNYNKEIKSEVPGIPDEVFRSLSMADLTALNLSAQLDAVIYALQEGDGSAIAESAAAILESMREDLTKTKCAIEMVIISMRNKTK